MARGKVLVLLIVFVFLSGTCLHYFKGYYDVQSPLPHGWGVDDAYITYRYGWNLFNYGNLSWNESGYRRTEGYTNPLWVVLSALWSLLNNKDFIYPGMVITSVLISGGILLFMGNLMLQFPGGNKNLMGLFILGCAPFLWLHATSGLEGTVFGLTLALVILLANQKFENMPHRVIWLSILSSSLCLLRSDGNIYLLVVICGMLVGTNKAYKPILIGMLLGSLAMYTSRIFLFGAFVPNTAIAKLNFDVLTRIKSGSLALLAVMLYGGIGLFVVTILGLSSLPKFQLVQTITILGGWAAYFIFIGGDMFLERHLIGFFALCAISLSWFLPKLNIGSRLILIAFVFLGYLIPFITHDPRYAYIQSKPPDPLIMLGKKMQKDRDKYGVVVIIPAGKVPFFAGGDFVDSIGLNDPELSNIKRDRFVPGHCSGSEEIAAQIAKQNTNGVYSFFTFFQPEKIDSYDDVLLWISNVTPQQGVQTKLTQLDWQFALSNLHPLDLSLIVSGK